MQHLDHARPVVGKRGMDRLSAAVSHELEPLGVGQWTRDEVAILNPRERPDPVA
jgi:hypothetical protein